VKLLWFVSRLVAFGGVAVVTFLYGLRGLMVGGFIGILLPWLGRLRAAKVKGKKSHPPTEPMRWSPQIRPLSIVASIIGGLSGVVLLQQYSVSVLTSGLMLRGLVAGLVTGIVLPSTIWIFVVRRYNRKLHSQGPARRVILPAATRMMIVACVAFVGVVLAAGPALARLSGPCGLTVGGRNARGLSVTDTGDAYLVGKSGGVPIFFSSPSEVISINSGIAYAGGSIPFINATGEPDEEDEDGSGSVAFEVPVGFAEKVSAGVFEMQAELVLADGRRCDAGFLFQFDVEDPLETVLGAAAGTAALMAAAGTMLPTLRDGAETLGSLSAGGAETSIPTGGDDTETLHGDAALEALAQAGAKTVTVDGQVYVVDPGYGDFDAPSIEVYVGASEDVRTVTLPSGEKVQVLEPGGSHSIVHKVPRAGTPPGADADVLPSSDQAAPDPSPDEVGHEPSVPGEPSDPGEPSEPSEPDEVNIGDAIVDRILDPDLVFEDMTGIIAEGAAPVPPPAGPEVTPPTDEGIGAPTITAAGSELSAPDEPVSPEQPQPIPPATPDAAGLYEAFSNAVLSGSTGQVDLDQVLPGIIGPDGSIEVTELMKLVPERVKTLAGMFTEPRLDTSGGRVVFTTKVDALFTQLEANVELVAEGGGLRAVPGPGAGSNMAADKLNEGLNTLNAKLADGDVYISEIAADGKVITFKKE
jgi:hypothetical protein